MIFGAKPVKTDVLVIGSGRIADPDPHRIILGSWIRIRFRVKK
jgi:hypothetical protein